MSSTQTPDTDIMEFSKITGEFICDLYRTFPELQESADERIVAFLEYIAADEGDIIAVQELKKYCMTVYPERFFDILYKNAEMFENEDINTEFLPGINFTYLWNIDGVSDESKTTLWNYLQLILFTIVGDVKDGSSFGDTAKLFEAIDETELKSKLEETMSQMKNVFQNMDKSESADEHSDPQFTDTDDIHNHLRGMLGGKIGGLAQEIAEETASELNISAENADDIQGVFQQLFKNPGKLMGLVKNVGSKLDTKIKSGDLKESELIQEATEIMGKMKDMPGMNNIQDILKKMGMGGDLADMMKGMGGKDTKMASTKSVETQLAQQLKIAKTKERRLDEIERRRKKKEEERHTSVMNMSNAPKELTPEEMDALVFSIGEPAERSTKSDNPGLKKKKKKKKK